MACAVSAWSALRDVVSGMFETSGDLPFRDGAPRRCQLVAAPMQDAAEWVERYRVFWEERLDALGDYLDNSQDKQKDKQKG